MIGNFKKQFKYTTKAQKSVKDKNIQGKAEMANLSEFFSAVAEKNLSLSLFLHAFQKLHLQLPYIPNYQIYENCKAL